MRIAIGNVSWREVNHLHARAMSELNVLLAKSKEDSYLECGVNGDALVSRSRSIVASHFLDRTQADVLLSIDSDIIFRAEDAVKLAHEASRYDIVAGLYMTRNIQTQPALMLPSDQPVDFASGSAPVEVPYVSTGFLAVNRRVFSKLKPTLPLCHASWGKESFYPFYMPFVSMGTDGKDNEYLSEDWAFVHRAKEAGFKVYVDPSIRLEHVGSYRYSLEDLLRPAKLPATDLRLTRDEAGNLESTVLE